MKRTNIFVYGTLKRNQRANHILTDAGAEFLGDCELPGYALYDLGAYPAIREARYSKVFGELWSIGSDRMEEMDIYEGEGSLYDRTKVTVICSDGEKADAEAYVWRGEIDLHIAKLGCSWPISNKIWYASYGSNISEERFNCYIEGGVCKENGKEYKGCIKDKSHWLKTVSGELNDAEVYFTNISNSWFSKGVAFLDPSAEGEKCWIKRYLINKGQFMEVWHQEWWGEGWYTDPVFLGTDEDDGYPIFTFTKAERTAYNPPSEEYKNLIVNAMKKDGVPEEKIKEYLK